MAWNNCGVTYFNKNNIISQSTNASETRQSNTFWFNATVQGTKFSGLGMSERIQYCTREIRETLKGYIISLISLLQAAVF